MRYLLGIDVGTTGTKTLLFRQDGKLLGHAYRAYETKSPDVGRSEQNPDDWWNAVVKTVREVCADPGIAQNVAGISLSLQGGTTVPVDAHFQPVRPAIVWSDNRCAQEREAYLREVGADSSIYEKTGWHLGYGLNALAIRWMKDHEPENFAKTAMFLSVPDYISYKMTGIPAVDLSDVGINQLGNIREGGYDKELLQFAGISEAQLPRIFHSGEKIGNLTEKAAEELGLHTGVVLAAGAHDQYAAALGAGACQAGDILIGSGTCWVITCIADQPDFCSGLSQSVAAVPGKWGSLWSLSSGGVCLEWWRRNLTMDASGNPISYDTINAEVKKRKAAENGLFFYPFSGCSGPDKAFQRASFIGLDLSHDKYDMARAIMEGVAFQIVWMLEKFKTRPSAEGLKLAGGAAKSELWCQIVADIADLPVRIPETADLACVGAAILAGVGSGVFESAEAGYRCMAIPERIIYPNPKYVGMYREQMKAYRRYAGLLGKMETNG